MQRSYATLLFYTLMWPFDLNAPPEVTPLVFSNIGKVDLETVSYKSPKLKSYEFPQKYHKATKSWQWGLKTLKEEDELTPEEWLHIIKEQGQNDRVFMSYYPSKPLLYLESATNSQRYFYFSFLGDPIVFYARVPGAKLAIDLRKKTLAVQTGGRSVSTHIEMNYQEANDKQTYKVELQKTGHTFASAQITVPQNSDPKKVLEYLLQHILYDISGDKGKTPPPQKQPTPLLLKTIGT